MRYTALAVDHPDGSFTADLDHETGVLYALDAVQALDLLWCIACRDLYAADPLNAHLLDIMSVIVAPGPENMCSARPYDALDDAFTRDNPLWGTRRIKRRYENGRAENPIRGFENSVEGAGHCNTHIDGTHSIITRSYGRAPSTMLLCSTNAAERDYVLDIERYDVLQTSFPREPRNIKGLFCEHASSLSEVPLVRGVPGCLTGFRGHASQGFETAHYRMPFFKPRYVTVARSGNQPPPDAFEGIRVTAASPHERSAAKARAIAFEFMPKRRLGRNA